MGTVHDFNRIIFYRFLNTPMMLRDSKTSIYELFV